MKNLTLAEKAWLQGLMSHRIVSLAQAKAMHKAAVLATHVEYAPDDFYAFNGVVSRAISRVGLEIRRTKDELSSTEMFVIVNAKGDPAAQLATSFTPQEVVFIKALIRQIFTAPQHAYSLSTMNASALGHSMEPEMPTSRVQAICKALIRQDWLQEQRGFYSLSLRALTELGNYLRSAFEEYVHVCVMCKDVVTKGYACSTADCTVWVHKGCRTSYESSIRSMDRQRMVCKECQSEWDPKEIGKPNVRAQLQRRRSNSAAVEVTRDEEEEVEHVEEKAEWSHDEDEEDRRRHPSRSDRAAKRQRTSQRRTQSSIEEEEEAEELDEETVPLKSDEEGDELESE